MTITMYQPGAFSVRTPQRCFQRMIPRARPSTNSAPAQGVSQSPQELLQIFKETQQNMVELNKSRLAALAEVKALRARVAELDAKVAELEHNAWDGKKPSFEAPGPAIHDEPGAYIPQVNSPAAQGPSITISYQSGWSRAYVHYNVDGKGWTQIPGEEMNMAGGGLREIVISGSRVEFVVNNGEGDWDTPNPFSGGKKNYVIEAPGKYHLKSGRVTQLA